MAKWFNCNWLSCYIRNRDIYETKVKTPTAIAPSFTTLLNAMIDTNVHIYKRNVLSQQLQIKVNKLSIEIEIWERMSLYTRNNMHGFHAHCQALIWCFTVGAYIGFNNGERNRRLLTDLPNSFIIILVSSQAQGL